MKKAYCGILLALAMVFSPGLRASALSDASVHVNVNVPVPPLMIPAPPLLLPIPGAYVYYPPDINAEIFFYHDHWYRPHAGRWYRADNYNGPWHTVRGRQIPRAVVGIPPHYRTAGPHFERISYHDVRSNHRAWEKNRHWDKDRGNHGRPHENNGRKEGHYKNHYKSDHKGRDR